MGQHYFTVRSLFYFALMRRVILRQLSRIDHFEPVKLDETVTFGR